MEGKNNSRELYPTCLGKERKKQRKYYTIILTVFLSERVNQSDSRAVEFL